MKKALIFCMLAIFAAVAPASGADMTDYCIKPPLIGSAIQPNMLLMIDNSASMYDLVYQDIGTSGTCSTSGAICATSSDCPDGQTCTNITTRTPTYCYDKTFNSNNTYYGYFETTDENGNAVFYTYDFGNKWFSKTASFPASCDISVANVLCLDDSGDNINTSKVLDTFVASGNYLNWLTASKFDIQKKVLTGGKYNTLDQLLLPESRGCVGYRFVKEANTGNFVPNATPTSLGVTFAVNGPMDPYNATAPSPGGTTTIEVFFGNYNEANCQAAIDAIATNAGNAAIKKAVEDCLSSTTSASAYCAKDASLTCASDANCNLGGGVCSITNNGVCNVTNNGVCGVSIAGTCGGGVTGVCTDYSASATCSGSGGSKVCGGAGPMNGKSCQNKQDCYKTCTAGDPAKIGVQNSCTTASNNSAECALPKTCSAGAASKIGTICAVNADCDEKKCTAGLVGNICTTNAGCNSSACTAGRVGNLCSVNADCNTNSCTSGDPAKIGTYCTSNTSCDNNKGPCLVPGASLQSKTGPVFNQSMQACWAYNKGTPLGNDEVNTVTNQCSDVYASLKACIGGTRDGRACSTNADCDGTTCGSGPDAIRPGNAAMLCSRDYTGYCADPVAGAWASTSWVAREYASSSECILQKHKEFCGVMQTPDVTDPSGALSTTSTYGNVPAIISGTGVISQLGDPIKTLTTRISTTTEPKNLIQQFGESIRIGAMSFNTVGSPSECTNALSKIPCPKMCSTSPDPNNPVLCTTRFDCPSPASATCDSYTDNRDGAEILHYIGYGYCYAKVSPSMSCDSDSACTAPAKCLGGFCALSTAVTCATAANCGSDEPCVTNGVGDHSSGLIKTIDDIRATNWTPFSEAFYNAVGYFAKDPADATGKTSRKDLRLSGGGITDTDRLDFHDEYNPSEYKCQRNNILLLTDGMSTADMHGSVKQLAQLYTAPTATNQISTAIGTDTCDFAGSKNLDDIAYLAKNYNIGTFSKTVTSPSPTTALYRQEYINTFVAFNGVSNGAPGQCNSEALLSATATNGGSVMQKASNYPQLFQALNNFFQQIAADTVSGTAASVLASGEGSGANLVQAVFYPTKEFASKTSAQWIGRLANLWYYVDPAFTYSNIREEDGLPAGDKVLYLKTDGSHHDYITQLFFDQTTKSAKARRWTDSNGDADTSGETQLADIPIDNVSSIWEAGKLLWNTGTGTNRRIKTVNLKGGSPADGMMEFSDGNASTLRSYLGAAGNAGASNIIKWTRGEDDPVTAGFAPIYRKRKVKLLSTDTAQTWKLGDVLNSTPRISSWQPLNEYHIVYATGADPLEKTYGPPGQRPYQSTPVNNSYYITQPAYKGRGMVYVGANDGMLHAFRLGLLEQKWSGQTSFEQARLANKVCSTNQYILCSSDSQCPSGQTCSITKTLGEEVWAFIPKNVLPYLRYMTDPAYCHIYTVDLTPFIFDASIGKPGTCGTDYSYCTKTAFTWRTILIGGMRLGGACRSSTGSCNIGNNCVKAPIQDPDNANKGLGYSSYFALDITDQNNPVFMWEFDGTFETAADTYRNYLGFATSGPQVVRIAQKNASGVADKTMMNGKWFVVFGSGPTGPIDKANAQFLGQSDQNLRLFAFDLANGPGAKNANVTVFNTGIQQAFSGALYGTSVDVDRDYSDDAVYIPYVSKPDGDIQRGGVIRLVTKENPSPSTWVPSVMIYGNIPVTSSITKVLNPERQEVWIYIGTGRYFYAKGNDMDDPGPPKTLGVGDDDWKKYRQLIGYKETTSTCLTVTDGALGYKATCDTAAAPPHFDCENPVSASDCAGLTNVDSVELTASDVAETDYKGWYINLDRQADYPQPTTVDTKTYLAERAVSDPTATSGGVVYFTTYRPLNDPCAMSGVTHLWAVKYDTGGSAKEFLKGKAVMQVSTGSIEQIDLASAFTERGDRRTAGIAGKPPESGKSAVFGAAGAVKKIIYLKER